MMRKLEKTIEKGIKHWMRNEFISNPEPYHDRTGLPVSSRLAESFCENAGIKVEEEYIPAIYEIAIDTINY